MFEFKVNDFLCLAKICFHNKPVSLVRLRCFIFSPALKTKASKVTLTGKLIQALVVIMLLAQIFLRQFYIHTDHLQLNVPHTSQTYLVLGLRTLWGLKVVWSGGIYPDVKKVAMFLQLVVLWPHAVLWFLCNFDQTNINEPHSQQK